MTTNNKFDNSELADSSVLSAGLKSVLKMGHIVFLLLTFAIIGLLGWYLTFSGAFTVTEQERVLVSNFGKLSKTVYTPGWHWNWPSPISDIVRIPVDKQDIVTNAFWLFEDPTRPQDPNSEPQASPLKPGRGGYLFTGDTNIIHISWGMFYHVSDPYKYYTKCIGPNDPKLPDTNEKDPDSGKYLGTRGPQTLINAIFENIIIEETATKSIDYALKSPLYVTLIETAVKRAIEEADIGIAVDKVWLAKPRTPPIAAARAFRAVFNASIFSFTEREKAKSYAIKMKNEAKSDSIKLITEAEAYQTRVVASIKADATYFKAILKEYKKNPEIVLLSRYYDVLGDVLRLADDKFVIRTNENGKQEIRILLNREPRKKKVKLDK